MKTTLFYALTVLLGMSHFPVSAQDAPSTADRNAPFWQFQKGALAVEADLTAVDDAKGDFGIDVRVDYQKFFNTTDLSGPVAPGWQFYDTVLQSNARGFLTISEEENLRNSLIAEGKFGFTGFYTSKAASQAQFGEKRKIDIDGDTPDDFSTAAAAVDSDWWLFGLVTAKYETTQDFEDYDVAFGGELAITSAPIAKLLDIPFRFLRTGEHNNPRQFDIATGIDYVTELDQTANAALRASDFEAWRVFAAAEWSTGILSERQRLAFRYECNYELDAPGGIKAAGRDFNHFFEARLQHLLVGEYGGRGTFATLKYTTGELAPNYEGEDLIGAGLTIDF